MADLRYQISELEEGGREFMAERKGAEEGKEEEIKLDDGRI
jgi:hypothetical protein